MSSAICQCRGACGAGRCLSRVPGRGQCGVRSGTPHPVDGVRTDIHHRMCHRCRAAAKRTEHHRQQREEHITATDGQTTSMFSLIAGGGFR